MLDRLANRYAYWSEDHIWPVCAVLCGCIVGACKIAEWL